LTECKDLISMLNLELRKHLERFNYGYKKSRKEKIRQFFFIVFPITPVVLNTIIFIKQMP
jgi:hypothetical protein